MASRLAISVLLILLPAEAQEKKPVLPGAEMDYGPFLSSTVNRVHSLPDKDMDVLVFKGISIKVGPDATMCYDTDLMRLAGAWTGGFLDLSDTHMTTSKGSVPPFIRGSLKVATKIGPGWAVGGDFKDPRATRRGPLPREWAQYKGLYLHGDQVVLSYTVAGCAVLESPGYHASGAFTRTFNMGASAVPLQLLVSDDESVGLVQVDVLGNASKALSFSPRVVDVPAHPGPIRFMVVMRNGPKIDAEAFKEVPDLKPLCKGGPARWKESVVTKGALGKEPGAYVVDTLTLPDVNPWKSWIRTSAHDFFSDGRVAICTWSGDVWVVSGVDDTLEKLTWKRFATGLYEPLGLRIVNDVVYALGRDQITRLVDLDGDGEADFYECFNNQCVTMSSYHAFHYDLQTDRAGNFYYMVGGNHTEPDTPMHSVLLKVSRDGSSVETIATGLRAPNGMGIGPNDEMVCGDNEGNWMPTSRLNWLKKGGFYGFVSDPTKTSPAHPALPHGEHEKPLCWIPKALDNSSGGQVWVTSDRWGPLKGHLLHTSYGTALLFHVPTQSVGGTMQGGVVPFPLKFASGIMRARFSPADGQLYVSGLRGWTTAGARDGCLQRVRYTGKPLRTLLDMRVTRSGLELTFTDPLDPEIAGDAGNYAVQQWNYEWSEKYGSPEFSVADPKKRARDTLEVKSATLSKDGKTVTLGIDGIRPVMQMAVKIRITSADRAPVSLDFHLTINQVE